MKDVNPIIVFAARYAHKRPTGATHQVVNCIIKNWDTFSDFTKKQLKREAKEEALYNIEEWERIEQL